MSGKKVKAYGDGDLFGPPKLDNTPTQEELDVILSDKYPKGKTSAPKAPARRSVSAPKIGSHSAVTSIHNQYNPMSDGQAKQFFANRKADPVRSIQRSLVPGIEKVLAQPKTTYSKDSTAKGTSDLINRLLSFGNKIGSTSKAKTTSGALAGLGSGGRLPLTGGVAEDVVLPTFGKTIADYLAEAGDGSSLISGELSAMDAREQALKQQALTGDSAIAQIYAGLQNSLGKSGEDAGSRYAAAGTAAQGIQDGTAATIAAAQKNSEGAQAEIRKNLGMGDVAPSAAQNYQSADQSNAQSALAATGKSQQDYLQSLSMANQDFYGSNKTAAGFRGAESRAGLQQDLATRLAEMQQDRSSLQSNASQQAQQLAMQRYQADYGQFSDERNYTESLADKNYDRTWQQAQARQESQYRQQELDAASAEAQSKYAQEQTAALPSYDKIQQQLMQAMPNHPWAVGQAMKVMAEQKNADPKGVKYQPVTLQTFLNENLNEQQARIALQAYSEYANAYKY